MLVFALDDASAKIIWNKPGTASRESGPCISTDLDFKILDMCKALWHILLFINTDNNTEKKF